jgi:hypothetical protein
MGMKQMLLHHWGLIINNNPSILILISKLICLAISTGRWGTNYFADIIG